MNLASSARIAARPRESVVEELSPGEHVITQSNGLQGQLYLPPRHGAPMPLAVLFHGATQRAERSIRFLRDLADVWRIALFAPQADGRTWDVLEGGYGRDIEPIDTALAWIFERVRIDASRIAAAGFSDGASYALSVGVTNGDLFTHIMAWSPGFIAPPEERGTPSIFVSHGVHDRMLPIDRCSRVIVPRLRAAGYDVEYREFDGPHRLPPDIAEASVRWFLTDAS
jgi:phospholipase/carboxylesterase